MPVQPMVGAPSSSHYHTDDIALARLGKRRESSAGAAFSDSLDQQAQAHRPISTATQSGPAGHEAPGGTLRPTAPASANSSDTGSFNSAPSRPSTETQNAVAPPHTGLGQVGENNAVLGLIDHGGQTIVQRNNDYLAVSNNTGVVGIAHNNSNILDSGNKNNFDIGNNTGNLDSLHNQGRTGIEINMGKFSSQANHSLQHVYKNKNEIEIKNNSGQVVVDKNQGVINVSEMEDGGRLLVNKQNGIVNHSRGDGKTVTHMPTGGQLRLDSYGDDSLSNISGNFKRHPVLAAGTYYQAGVGQVFPTIVAGSSALGILPGGKTSNNITHHKLPGS